MNSLYISTYYLISFINGSEISITITEADVSIDDQQLHRECIAAKSPACAKK